EGGKVNESAGQKLWKRRAQNALGNRRSDFHFSHSFNNNKLDDRDHFLQNAKTSVASLRRLITPTRNADHDQPGTLITFIGIRILCRKLLCNLHGHAKWPSIPCALPPCVHASGKIVWKECTFHCRC